MPHPELPNQSEYATVNELANQLGLVRRSALNVLHTCAAHLGIPIYAAERNQLQIRRADFDRIVEFANLLRSVGLSVHQVEAIRACTNPLLWSVLGGPEEPISPATRNDTEDAISRIEGSLADFLQKQETVVKQQLDLLHHVVSLLPPAPAPAPAPARRESRE